MAEKFDIASAETVLMTSDEWRVQGIEFALSAESENAVMFLEGGQVLHSGGRPGVAHKMHF